MSTRPTSLCPVCGRPATIDARPFCSPRCADIDLGRWVTGQYRIPAPADAYDDQASDPPEC
ncbi:MAG TPA: DNA gyrase inhibitor YacG [Acetobacteraceae bacterium]|nr:DNA gyrase inhibitor YacG [Acetobacteraceae bacterium]